MKKRSFNIILILFLTLLITQFISIQAAELQAGTGGNDPGVDQMNKYIEQNDVNSLKEVFSKNPILIEKYPEQFKKFLEKEGINYKGSTIGIKYSEKGILTTQDGSKINLNSFKDKGYTISSDANKVTLTDKNGKEVDLKGGENLNLDSNGALSMDSVQSLQVGTTVITGGVNVEVYGDKITADHVETFTKDGSVVGNVNNLDSTKEYFSVEKAESFWSSGITISDIDDATFKVDNTQVEIITDEGNVLKITDSNFADVTFTAIEDNSSIIISKVPPGIYNISEGILEFNSTDFSEKIEANNTVIVTLDPNYGFSYISITPPGTYYYNDKNTLKDFAVHIPPYGEKYSLCIKKDEIQNFNNLECDGFIDFLNKKINLDGIVDYLRYQFNENGILTDLFLKPTYQGKNNQIIMNSTLDSDFIFLNSFFIGIRNNGEIICSNENMISEAFNLNYHIIEICNPLVNEVERYIGFKDNNPTIINNYNSNFGTKHSEIVFNNKILIK